MTRPPNLLPRFDRPSRYRQSTAVLLVDGVRVGFTQARTLHGVRNPVGQLTFSVPTPLPAALQGDPVGRRVTLTATMVTHEGWVANRRRNLRQESSVVFSGTVRRLDRDADPSGRTQTFGCADDLWMLGVDVTEDLAWDGPIDATELIRGRLQAKGYGTVRRQPMFLDTLRFPDGTTLVLGGNALVDDGQVILREGTNDLGLMNNIAGVCGYALYGLPTGSPRLSRVMGIPPAIGTTDPFRSDGGYRVIDARDEGFTWRGGQDADLSTNYWEVTGARWTEADGTAVEIRSFPDTAALIVPDIPSDVGLRREAFGSPYLLTQAQADGARNIREMDTGGRVRTVAIEVDGMPTVYPGHVHKVVNPDQGVDETYVAMTVSHTFDDGGSHRTLLTYRRGAGTALPAGVDQCVFRSLFTAPIHLGDEPVAWYAVPSPTSGVETRYPFTPTEEQTGLAFVARGHGCNSQYVSNPPEDGLTGSKVVVEQLEAGGVAGDDEDWRKVGENDLPVLDERYPEQRPYSSDGEWVDVRVAIPGTLEAGRPARVRIVAGTDGVGVDDFELKGASLMSCKAGQPKLPGSPRPPGTATPPPQQPGSTSPGGGTQGRPNTPAGIRLLTDGTVGPSSGGTPTCGAQYLDAGTRTIRMVGQFTGLSAGAGSRGSGWAEYFRLSIERTDGARLTLYGRLLNGSGVVQAGSGERSFSFDVTSFLAGQRGTLRSRVRGEPGTVDRTLIVSEAATITVARWDAQVSR